MRRIKTQFLAVGFSALLATPVFAQGRGQGVGGVVGGVTGGATGAVNSTVNGTVQRPPTAAVGQQAPAGRGIGASTDTALRVTQNAALSAQLQPLLPSGATLSGAATGFQNEGQFAAALHAAHNLNIPFDQLKANMTGAKPESLGKAIQTLRPSLDSKAIKDDTKLAERQAERDLNSKPGSKPGPVASHIASNANLATRLESMLPAGMTLQSAAAGFKNDGQFISALQVSKNLNIPFADLKDRVTAGQSLGDAIHALKPDLSPEAVASDAKQAEDESVKIQADTSVRASASTKSSQ